MGQFFILRSRVLQEYNSLLVNALNRIFQNNLSLNNFKWLLTKLDLSCVRHFIPRSRKRLWNGYPVLHQELQNHDPVGGTYPYTLCMGVPPPPGTGFLFSLTSKEEHNRTRSWFLITLISSWLQLVWRHWFLLASLLHLFHSWFPE